MSAIEPILRNVFVAAGLAIALPACAASIYGTVKRGGQPLGGASVQLACGNTQSAGQTDARGNYSLSIAVGGNCTLRVDNQAAPVTLGNQPARYDFEAPASGNVLLQR